MFTLVQFKFIKSHYSKSEVRLTQNKNFLLLIYFWIGEVHEVT